MNETIHHRPSLDELAEEFAERYRRGERPTVEEYAAAHPELASEIRDLFPTLAMMEELAPSGASEPEASATGASIEVKPLDRIGDFRILREIGRGGMGVVYEAEQESLGRRVALKVLPLHSASDPKMLARFRRESRAAGQLHHTNIVPIFEVGEYGDICWYAMQFIPGQALDEVVKELQRLRAGKGKEPVQPSPLTLSLMEESPVHGPDVNKTDAYRPIAAETGCIASDSTPMPQSVRCNEELVELDFRLCCRNVSRIGLQVADALAFAHARGVIHRDIKPSNLLLDTAGIVWVSDFGLAKTQDHALTETGDIVGTVRYMAPERFRGECDARSDIYSLGVTMYELLTLKPAFDNSDRLKLIDSIGHAEPAKPRSIEPQIPRDVETIVLKAIEKDPRRRYPTAEAMAADLRRYLNDEPIQARRVGMTERAWRWVRRNPVVTGLVAFAVIDLLVFLLVVLSQNQNLTAQRDAAQAARDELRRTLYASQMNLVQSAYEADNVARALDILEKQRPKQGAPDLRGWEWHYWRRQCRDFDRETLLPSIDTTCHAVFSPDGRRLIISPAINGVGFHSLGRLSFLELLDSATGKSLLRRQLPDQSDNRIVYAATFSPDGQMLALIAGSGFFRDEQPTMRVDLIDVTGPDIGSEPRTIQIPTQTGPLAFLKDGRRIGGVEYPKASGGRSKSFSIWDAETGKKLSAIDVGANATGRPVFSPDGSRVCLAVAAPPKPGPRWSSDDQQDLIRTWDLSTGEPLQTLNERVDSFGTRAYSPNGRWLAALSPKGNQVVIWEAASGREHRRLITSATSREGVGATESTFLAFSPDSAKLAVAVDWNPTAQIWDVESGKIVRLLKGHTGRILAIAFHRDTGQVLTVASDRTIRSWILPSSPPLDIVEQCVAVSNDRRMIAAYDVMTDFDSMAITIRESDARKIVQKIELKALSRSKRQVSYIRGADVPVFSADGRQLIVPVDDVPTRTTGLSVIDLASGQPARTISLNRLLEAISINLALSGDGRRLATTWTEKPKDEPARNSTEEVTRCMVLDFATGRELINVIGDRDAKHVGVMSHDGTHLAMPVNVNGTTFVRLWDIDSGRELRDIPVASAVTALAFGVSGRGILVMTGGDGNTPSTGTAYDIKTGEVLTQVRGVFGRATAIAFSPDGKRLAIASSIQETQSGEVKLWDLTSERELMTLKAPEMHPRSLHFSPDGHKLVFLGARTGVTIWDGTPLPE